MTLSAVLRTSAVASAAFGLPLLLAPAAVLSGVYGLRVDGATELVARILGGQLLGWAVLDWRAGAGHAPREANVGGATAESASLVGSVVAAGAAGGNALVWTIPLIFAAFIALRRYAPSGREASRAAAA